MFPAQFLECTAPSYDELWFKRPSPEHNPGALRQKYKPMKVLIYEPELSTSAPYLDDNQGIGTVHTERSFEC